ncbi:hypothetical protein L486_01593 [Kwoniella mangroviensis CBS 10435]|uniref:Uncharacterized protein n=1 Tax=Kwoniella mangroviensis CBS 10435 TaxID=1331196 RepID=A0A1B9J2F9_9TREE|nr:hypothetical protein L486_01593 [Kwoniella mangroviensis CBS 10435]
MFAPLNRLTSSASASDDKSEETTAYVCGLRSKIEPSSIVDIPLRSANTRGSISGSNTTEPGSCAIDAVAVAVSDINEFKTDEDPNSSVTSQLFVQLGQDELERIVAERTKGRLEAGSIPDTHSAALNAILSGVNLEA